VELKEDDEPSERRAAYGVGRLLALSDGVFAIAMTLLVLDIPAPHLANPTEADLLQALLELRPNLLAFGLSFVLVGIQWLYHHRLFQDVSRVNGALVLMNLLLLLLVCLVPFTTAMLARYGDHATGAILYASNMAALGLSEVGLQVVSWRGHLLHPRPTATDQRRIVIRALIGVAVFVVSIPIAFVNATWAEYSWLALLLLGPLMNRFGLEVRTWNKAAHKSEVDRVR
jgi:uncharacterized membrane protein